MSTDILFLAEFAGGAPTRSALELAAGAAELAGAVRRRGRRAGLRSRGRRRCQALGAHGAARVIVLGDEDRPAITYARPRRSPRPRDGRPRAARPATPNGRDLAAALVGTLDCRPSGRCAPHECRRRYRDGAGHAAGQRDHDLRTGDGAPPRRSSWCWPTRSPRRGRLGTAEVTDAPGGRRSACAGRPSPRATGRGQGRQPRGGDVIVAGGRGVGGEEGFGPLRELAAALGGAVGASRAAADAGWIPYQLQIGQTGKVVKPALYIGAGISGAIQHRVGMQTAEHVVAINRDPDAPIGEFADLFVVGDLFQIVPALTDEIRKRKGS